MKRLIYIVALFVLVLSACKTSATSATTTAKTPKNQQSQTSANSETNVDEEPESTQEVVDPKGVSTMSPLKNPSTPVKKYPPSGN